MTTNYGLRGGTLMPPPPGNFASIDELMCFHMLARVATKLLHEGYHIDANKVIDVVLDWRETGGWPEPFEVAGETVTIGYLANGGSTPEVEE
jgi:hypothetical protein